MKLRIAIFKVGFFNKVDHIFPKARVVSNKNAHNFQYHFLGTFFHALSHDVIHFVPRVSSKNLEMEVSDWLLKNFNQGESGFST